MGWQVIKQPNNKYCIFSSVVDNVTHYNCTRDEIIQVFINHEAESIRRRLTATLDALDAGEKPYCQFTKTFDEMINTIINIHSDVEAKEVLKLISNP